MKLYLPLVLSFFLSLNTFAEDGDDRCDLKNGGLSWTQPQYITTSSPLTLRLWDCELVTPNPNAKCELKADLLTLDEYCKYSYSSDCYFSWVDFFTFNFYNRTHPSPWYYLKIYCEYIETTIIESSDTTGEQQEEVEEPPVVPNSDGQQTDTDTKRNGKRGPTPNG